MGRRIGGAIGTAVGAILGDGDGIGVWARVGNNGNIITKIAGVNDRPRR